MTCSVARFPMTSKVADFHHIAVETVIDIPDQEQKEGNLQLFHKKQKNKNVCSHLSQEFSKINFDSWKFKFKF